MKFARAAVGLIVFFAAAQLVRPARVNPAIDAGRTIAAHVAPASGLAAVLDRACGDCHSNGTVWSRYTQIAPVSWVIVHGVNAGRKAVNFSEWAGYPPEVRRQLLLASCRDASEGRMPGRPFTLIRPDAQLSPEDVETICAAARQHPAGAF
jgi:heme-binding protein